MDALDLNLITLRHAHHAKASGYDRLADHLHGRVIPPVDEWGLRDRILARLALSRIERCGSRWYHRDSFIRELRVARQWLRRRGQLFHFFYGENSFRFAGELKRIAPGNRLVCTYHTPPERFREVVRDRAHLRHIDALVVLSTMALDFFGDLVGRERVHYVPRGVDTDWFTPAPGTRAPRDSFDVLFVGSHLRDFETLAGAAAQLRRCAPSVRFKVLTFRRNHAYFDGLDNVDLLPELTDLELLQAYRHADVLALPLRDTTANNVVVEAMACALPVVATDLIGVRDYVSPDCAVLTPKGDGDALAEAIRGLAETPQRRDDMAVAARRRALDFSLPRVAQRLMGLYAEVMASEPLADAVRRNG